MWYEYIILLIGILVLFNFLEVVFLIFRVIYMVISSLHSTWTYTVYCSFVEAI